MNGSYKPTWYYDQPVTAGWGGGEYGPMLTNAPQEKYYIFWNPDSPVSREVTLKICTQQTETTYNYTTLGTGIFLIATGAVAGSVAAYTLGRRLLLTLVAFTLILLGVFLVTTYPKMFEGKETVATNSLTIPAHGSINELMHYNTSDSYIITLAGPNGRVNTTVVPEADFTAFTQGKYDDAYWQEWRGSHYPVYGLAMGNMSAKDVRFVLVNPEAFDEQVSVQVDRIWVGTDYSGLGGGVLLVALGIVVLFFVHRRQLGEFNRALENQE